MIRREFFQTLGTKNILNDNLFGLGKFWFVMVRQEGIEPPTPGSEDRCSIR